jgi:hypothetical protein
VWGDNLLLGVGFNLYGFVQTWYGFDRLGSATFSLDGGLLFIGVMTGVVGLAVYSAMLWLVLRRAWRGWRTPALSPEARGLAPRIAAATVALVVHSLFVNTLLLPFLMEPLWILWGLAAVLVRERGWPGPAILVDQGTSDAFLETQLKPQLLQEACAEAGVPLRLRMQEGYDHSYYFIATFIEDHLRFHAAHLAAA